MKNELRKEYDKYQQIKTAYDAAEKSGSEEEMKQARADYVAWTESVNAKGKIYGRLYRLTEEAMERGNEYIDLNDCVWDRDVKELTDSFREYGIEAFTFSSGWSGAAETAWLFTKNGCTLEGLIEINGPHKAFMSEEYEKAHGYLFRVH